MQNKVKITVTQNHIDRGCRMSPCACPIALAIIDAKIIHNPYVCNQEVHNSVIIDKYIKRTIKLFNLPKKASIFIGKFDADRKSVKPFTFTMIKV